MQNYFFRYSFYFFGLILFSLGSAITVKVRHLGLHPWDVLNVALFQHFGITIGFWSVAVGMLLIGVSFLTAKKYVHIGTFLNALLIGPILDFFLWTGWLPEATHSWIDYFILLSGVIIVGIGGGMYVSGGIGAGPRDGFMLSISERLNLSVQRARIIVESIVLVIGFILGGPVFWTSLFYTFILSPIFQFSLKLFTRVQFRLQMVV
ncbi:MAG TPA: hypothetical protein VFF21_07880 [Flavobacteriaceae bacterium]|nr:hypothetical protein [Flavobacteriaceae bacterium]